VFSLALPASAAPLDARVAACLACHGEKGQSALPEVPSLGAQPALYVLIQLVMFRERLRIVEVMNVQTHGLTDDELREISATMAKLPPPQPADGPADTARLERAQALSRQHRCNFCHQRNYSGEESVPRLAGQREDYLVKALREYKGNTRRAYDPAMADVVSAISDEEILDLAYYLSRFR
jgi:cytochrome c553